MGTPPLPPHARLFSHMHFYFPFLDFCFFNFRSFSFLNFGSVIYKKCPSSCVVTHCATSASVLASLAELSRMEGGGGGVPRCCQAAFGLAAAGRKGGGGVPWRFGAAALQHHRQQEGRAVAAVGMPLRFGGRDVHATAG